MKQSHRRLILSCHRWAGMTIGSAVLYMALTGAGLAFRPQLDPVVNHDLLAASSCTTPLPLDQLSDRARAVHPGSTLESLRFAPGASLAVHFIDGEMVYLDPCEGRVMGQRDAFAGLFGTLEKLHRLLFLAQRDMVLAAVLLPFLVLIIVGGAVSWWPGRRIGMKIDLRLRGRALLANLHRTVGLYAGVILLMTATTGLIMVAGWGKAGQPRYVIAGAAAADPAMLWRAARPLLSDPREILMRLPRRAGDPVRLLALEAGAPHPRARDEVVLDPASGAVLKFTPYGKSSAGAKLANWAVALHTGQVGGLFGAMLVFAGALSVPILAFCGIALYAARRKKLSRAPSSPGASGGRSA